MSTPRNTESLQIITSVSRRRRFSPAEKIEFIQKTRSPGHSVSSVAREYGISPSLLFQWRRLMEQGQLESVTSEEEVVAASKVKELEKRIRSLERVLGRKTEEVEILKEAVRIGREKKLISQKPLLGLDDFE